MLHIVASITGLVPNELVYNLGDVHIYENAIDATKLMLSRSGHPLPKLVMPKIGNLSDLKKYTAHDFKLEGYVSDPAIKVEMAH